MDAYQFDDALTGSHVECYYPGLQALMVEGQDAPSACASLFFPGCSFINYGLPLVQAVYDLLLKAGQVQGISLLCCGKILSYEPNGKVIRARFEDELLDHVAAAQVKRLVCACPNCVFALRAALARDERTADVEVKPLVELLVEMGYRIDGEVARSMLDELLRERRPEWYDAKGAALPESPAAALRFMPKDSCPDRRTGEFARGLRAIMGEGLLANNPHSFKDSICCGSLARAAGKYELADKQAQEHGTDALTSGAAAIVTACVSCSFQLTMAQHEVPVLHYLELLFNWRIDWAIADAYMKLRFLFNDSLDPDDPGSGRRSFVGLGGDAAESAAADDAPAEAEGAVPENESE